MEKKFIKQINALFSNCLHKGEVTSRDIVTFVPSKLYEDATIKFDTAKLSMIKHTIIELFDSLFTNVIQEDDNDKFLGLKELRSYSNENDDEESKKAMDKLVLMAMAANVTSVFERKAAGYVYATRTTACDTKPIIGVGSPLLEENERNIAQKLAYGMGTIKSGLGFLGLNVRLNDEVKNQLDFYDAGGRYVTSRKYENTNGIFGNGLMLGFSLGTTFYDSSENSISFACLNNDDEDEQLFRFIAYTSDDKNSTVEILKFNDQVLPTGISVTLWNKNSVYQFVKLLINKNNLLVHLKNKVEEKKFSYADSETVSMTGKTPFISYDLTSDTNKIVLNGKDFARFSSAEQQAYCTRLIAHHPANKEFILFVLEEIDKQMPGIKKYVCQNFALFNSLVAENSLSEADDAIVNEAVKEVIDDGWDLGKHPKKMTRKNGTKL